MSSKTRKLIWSVPLMATLAVVGALAVFVALGLPNAGPAEAALRSPEIESATAGNKKITVVFYSRNTGGTPITGYMLQYAKADTNNGAVAAMEEIAADDTPDETSGAMSLGADAEGTDVVITGLDNDDEYWVRLRAINDGVNSSWTSAYPDGDDGRTPNPVKPDAPQNLEVDSVTSTSITITWDEPDDDGGHEEGVSDYLFSWALHISSRVGK